MTEIGQQRTDYDRDWPAENRLWQRLHSREQTMTEMGSREQSMTEIAQQRTDYDRDCPAVNRLWQRWPSCCKVVAINKTMQRIVHKSNKSVTSVDTKATAENNAHNTVATTSISVSIERLQRTQAQSRCPPPCECVLRQDLRDFLKLKTPPYYVSPSRPEGQRRCRYSSRGVH